MGSWSAADIAAYLKTGVGKGKTTTLGPMAEVIRNSTSFLTDDDRLAMAEYLKSIPPDSRLRTGRVAPDPTKARGAQLYTDNCSGCHQAQGRGIPGVFPPLAGNPVVVAADPNNIVKVIDRGIPARAGYVAMPGFATQPHRAAGRRDRQLPAHELGQQRRRQCDFEYGGRAARVAQLT